MIRNWLPHDEQQSLDELIQQVRRKNIMPAPYPASKVTKLVSSIVDGAGVQCIMFETKTKNQRTIAGFLLKEGIGIREPFVMHLMLLQLLRQNPKNLLYTPNLGYGITTVR